LLQIGVNREFFFHGKRLSKPAVDLVIADFPDGLPVPGLSKPMSQVPTWNVQVQDFLKLTIGFCGGYLHDDGALLLFYPENPQVKKELLSFLNKNNLKVKEEWTVINSLHLAHPLNTSKYVSVRFQLFKPIGVSG